MEGHQNDAYPIPWAIRHREGILCQQGYSNSKYQRKKLLWHIERFMMESNRDNVVYMNFQSTRLILNSCRHARSRFQIYLDKTKKVETEYIAQKKRKEIDAVMKDSKTKKQKLEVLVKQLYDEADSLSSDAEKKNKMSILVKVNALREKEKQRS